MRRRARVVHFARRPISSFVRGLKSKLADKLNPHLGLAQDILQVELKLSEDTSRSILAGAASLAHECAVAINQRAANIFQLQTSAKLRKELRRIANCAKRAPVRLRRRLDAMVVPHIRESIIDVEVINAVFDAFVLAFAKFPKLEESKTALRLMCASPEHDRAVLIKSRYEAVGSVFQGKAHDAIMALARSPGCVSTSDVFAALAAAIDPGGTVTSNSEIHDLIVEYVAKVAALWRESGLRPSRAVAPDDPAYRSRFYRFVEFVLTAMTEPDVQRHLISENATRMRIEKAYRRLPEEYRQIARSGPRRADVEWLVSDDHVKKALRKAA